MKARAATPQPSMLAASPKATGIMFVGLMTVMLIEYCGFYKDLPLLRTIRFTTVVSYLLLVLVLFRVGVGDLFSRIQSKILLGFVLFTMASVLWAVVSTHAFNTIRPFVDYFVFFILAASLIDRRQRFDLLSYVCVIIATTVVIRSLAKLGATVRSGGLNAGYFMGDGNDFAWGLVVMLPIILNLVFGERKLLVRLIGMSGAAMCMIGIVGSGSRGGTLGVAAAALYYMVFESRRKGATLALVAVAAAGVLIFAPSTYLSRMQSVGSYEEDSSAQARLQVWGAGLRMALTRPLGVGAGNFPAAYGRYYKPGEGESRIAWAPNRWLNAHSIYFRTLGEYGFIGLFMLLGLLWANLRQNFAVRNALRADPGQTVMPMIWPSLVNMSVVGYAVCGVFLGGITYPHIFLLCGLTVVNLRLINLSRKAAGLEPLVAKPAGRGRARRPKAGTLKSRDTPQGT